MTLAAPPAPPGLTRGARPTFSVIIAAYQAATLVADAVGSALEQEPPPLEIVVCDDGSTDGTAEALAAFGERITVLRQANRGEAGARNTAARAASGDYVAVLDADDVFLPGRLAALGDALAARPDLDILTTDAWIELDGLRLRRVYEHGYRFPVAEQRTAILHNNFVFGICAVRRSALLAAGGYDESIRHATDWDLYLRLVLSGSVVGCVQEPLAVYRLQRGSLSSQRASMLAGRLQILEKTARRDDLSDHERRVLRASLQEHRSRFELIRAREALAAGSPKARRLAARAAFAGGQSARSRIKLTASALAPGWAGRALRKRPVETTAGVLLEPAADQGQ